MAKLCEADGHMQQKLKQLLKLSKEKWDAACEHAKTAVQVHSHSTWSHPPQKDLPTKFAGMVYQKRDTAYLQTLNLHTLDAGGQQDASMVCKNVSLGLI